MPKIGLYFKDDDAEYYENEFKPAVEQAGDTVGSAFAVAMKEYVAGHEKKSAGLSEIQVFIGEMHGTLGMIGEHVKFVGRLIAKDSREDGGDRFYEQALYLTRKQKLLLVEKRGLMDDVTSEYRTFDNLEHLGKVQLLPNVSSGLKEENVGVRYLDI